jgi:hypothetical protein
MKPTHILFIGSSFTNRNDLQALPNGLRLLESRRIE